MAKKKPVFNVILVKYNGDVEQYDIMPKIMEEWQTQKKHKYKYWTQHTVGSQITYMPRTLEEMQQFVRYATMDFWCRCEYEMLVKDWPCGKKETKIDVYTQIDMNNEVVAKLLMDYYYGSKSK